MKAKPIDEEIELNANSYIVTYTDSKGNILYANKYFMEITGYNKEELLHKPHSIVRHPDMPRIIFKIMWEKIQKGENIMAIVKNLAKDGRYYWVVTDFETRRDKYTKKISYVAFRKAAAREAIQAVIPLYKKLCEIEKKESMVASENYLNYFLESKNMTYDQFVDVTVGNKGLFKLFFVAMKKFFK